MKLGRKLRIDFFVTTMRIRRKKFKKERRGLRVKSKGYASEVAQCANTQLHSLPTSGH